MTDDDPVAHASSKFVSWATAAATVAEAFTHVAAKRTREQAERLDAAPRSQAVRPVADVVQRSFPDMGGQRESSVTLSDDEVRREWLRTTVKAAERFYAEQTAGSWVPEYLRGRRLEGCLEAGSAWQVGYAPASWTALVDHMRGRQYSDDDLLEAGLASRSKRGTLVDRFRDRLMVSVRDADGRTVGFVGRANPESTSQRVPKYLNSPETLIYEKGELMLGLAEQAAELRLGARPVVVEGAFDAMALTEAGEGRYVGVAPSGTAVTGPQMRELRKVTSGEAVFAMDGDMAGRQAVVRAHAAAHRAGFTDLRAAVLPAGCDPADLWRGGRVTPLTQALDHAQPMADLVVDARLDEWPHGFSSYPERVNAARSAATVIVELPADDRARQVGRVAEWLRLDVTVVTDAVTDAVGRDGLISTAARSRAPADLSR